MPTQQMVDIDIEYFPTDPMTSLTIFMKSADDTTVHNKAFRRVGQDIVNKARQNIISNGSYQTGNLHDSVYAKLTNGGLEVGAEAHYGSHIEYGFRHWKNGQFIPAQPYIRPAISDSSSDMAEGLGDEIEQDYLMKLATAGTTGFSKGYQSFGNLTSTGNIGKFGGWQTGSMYK